MAIQMQVVGWEVCRQTFVALRSLCVPAVFEVASMGTLFLGFPQLADRFVVCLIQLKPLHKGILCSMGMFEIL